ncbi:DUF1758 domain-containing protein [Trichonephila inaurata madagascariensis]|uniref:DUF1758 domain-containing protein n=1 Tax=Trichonephila inaurata madagascariensis TaxID=2747483 RepID=A0A8X6XQ49_9ARAC|nr:DUF1758 domain-containing protein [Trichonephila inaurata madagascariensis]
MKALEVRYENTRALVDIHIAEILSINKLNSENPSQIRSIIDKVRNHLRSLKNLNFESNPLSDAIILHILSHKIDKESQRLFHLSLTTTKVPSLDEFISFLELRCIQLEAVIKPPEIAGKNVPIKNKPAFGLINPRWKSFLTKEKLKPTTSVESIQGEKECLICHKKNKHPIFNCESFLNQSPLKSLLYTRGILPSQLLAHDQWIQGPLWLNQPMNEMSSYKIPETFSFPDNALKEKRSVVTCVAKIVPLPEFIDRISSFTKLVRVCAWILRFIKNSRSPVTRTFGYLKSSELHTAVVTIIAACLNSRPLTELSPDPSDFNALIPAHFLVGGPIHQFPEPSQPSRSVGLSER